MISHAYHHRLAAAALAALSLATGTALASPGPADDRLIQTPTDWLPATGLSTAEVQAIVDDGGFRITDLRIEGTSPMRYSLVKVRNTGAYAVAGSFFFHGVTFDAVNTFRDNNKRPLIMQAYVSDGVTKFAGITVPNTGANHRSWKAMVGSYDFVTSHLADGFRPMTIGTFINDSGDRHYVILSVENTEGYGWWWWFGLSAAELDNKVAPYKSIIDASADDDDAMDRNVVLYNLPTKHGVVQGTAAYDTSWFDLWINAVGDQERPLFITHYTLHGSGTADGETEYFASLVDNY